MQRSVFTLQMAGDKGAGGGYKIRPAVSAGVGSPACFSRGWSPKEADDTLAFMILLFTRMILGVDLLQIVDGHMGIDLGGFQGLMTEHFL